MDQDMGHSVYSILIVQEIYARRNKLHVIRTHFACLCTLNFFDLFIYYLFKETVRSSDTAKGAG